MISPIPDFVKRFYLVSFNQAPINGISSRVTSKPTDEIIVRKLLLNMGRYSRMKHIAYLRLLKRTISQNQRGISEIMAFPPRCLTCSDARCYWEMWSLLHYRDISLVVGSSLEDNDDRCSSASFVPAYSYDAPEIESGIYTFEGDVYSCGVVISELLTGRMSYDCLGEQFLVR
ncbi:uncharacterized protein LOC114077542 isoform X2 [Solanum pennellii]|uniref:Uncharacterized protein LOC114077542 isoform X2 n=1 Tax=Solanum pennellii TaxID=28526 RepID=A0ABM1VCD8_SOLPN|nr:uncharacterized protein LOC114077542 isoform X2 [Solanum pennellii]